MKANWKRILKYLGLAFLGACLFFAGLCVNFVRDFAAMAKPRVHSDYSIRCKLEIKVGRLPPSAYRLYYAADGFQDTNFFIAFSANTNDCDAFLKSYLGKSVSSLRRVNSLPKRVTTYGPDSWEPEHRDPNWDLAEESEIQIYDEERQTVLYSASRSRLFICIWDYYYRQVE